MKVCVLQPDYSPSTVDYRLYDPPRDLTPLLPEHQVDHVALNKLTTFRQMKDLAQQGYDIFVNLCEGYPDWDVPSIDVIYAFEQLNLPYTGPPPHLYDVPKKVMKYVAYSAGVGTPVTLWGEGLPADEVALAAGTVSYELLCALAPRVPVGEI